MERSEEKESGRAAGASLDLQLEKIMQLEETYGRSG